MLVSEGLPKIMLPEAGWIPSVQSVIETSWRANDLSGFLFLIFDTSPGVNSCKFTLQAQPPGRASWRFFTCDSAFNYEPNRFRSESKSVRTPTKLEEYSWRASPYLIQYSAPKFGIPPLSAVPMRLLICQKTSLVSVDLNQGDFSMTGQFSALPWGANNQGDRR